MIQAGRIGKGQSISHGDGNEGMVQKLFLV